jgi:hypothetical protein
MKNILFRARDSNGNFITDYTLIKVFYLNGDKSLFTLMCKDQNGDYCDIEMEA